jgi:type II secretion system protein G
MIRTHDSVPTPSTERGFTLVELLVVVAIIGLLSSVVLASVNSMRMKSRDAQRISEIKEVQKALEFYYDDHGHYPPGPSHAVCSATARLQVLVDEGYLVSVPRDPLGGASEPYCYNYIAQPTSFTSGWFCNGVCRTNAQYVISFTLEYDIEGIMNLTGTPAANHCVMVR